MEGIKGFFDSFKEFVWDIIGYLLPGAFLLILLSATINEQYFYSSKLVDNEYGLFGFIFIVLSYLIGYVIYGIGLYKEDLFKKSSYKSKIEDNISKKNEFLICKQVYEKEAQGEGLTVSQNLSVRELRTIVMGYIPEADQKIYTFTFRSELSNHIGNISLLFGALGLVFWGLQSFFNFLFIKIEFKYILLYLMLIAIFFFLRKTRDRFYDIAMRVPFSIYMAKERKK